MPGRPSGRVIGVSRISWAITVEPETDDASLVTLSIRARATDTASRERLFEAWPLLGPIVDLHAHRILHSIEALAEEISEDPAEGDARPAGKHLRVIS